MHNLVILLQIIKITFEKCENLKKIHISQNLAKILTENCRFLLVQIPVSKIPTSTTSSSNFSVLHDKLAQLLFF